MSSLPFLRSSSPFNASRALIARLFSGIELDPDHEARALEIVAESIDARLAVTLRNADGWSRLVALNASRDAALRSLIDTPDDRARFDAQCAELRAVQAEHRPSFDNAPVVLRVGRRAALGRHARDRVSRGWDVGRRDGVGVVAHRARVSERCGADGVEPDRDGRGYSRAARSVCVVFAIGDADVRAAERWVVGGAAGVVIAVSAGRVTSQRVRLRGADAFLMLARLSSSVEFA